MTLAQLIKATWSSTAGRSIILSITILLLCVQENSNDSSSVVLIVRGRCKETLSDVVFNGW